MNVDDREVELPVRRNFYHFCTVCGEECIGTFPVYFSTIHGLRHNCSCPILSRYFGVFGWVLLLIFLTLHTRQTFADAERHHWDSMEKEWEKEKEKILNSLLGSNQEMEFPTETEVCLCM